MYGIISRWAHIFLVLVCAVAAGEPASAQADDSLPGFNEAEIQQILRDRVDVDGRSVGMVIAVLSEQGSRVYGYGSTGDSTGRRPDGDTVFEIGSVTKVFTAILLDDLAMRGKVALDDPLSTYLPDSVRVPERDGRAITLRELATHTSGLPRVPVFDPPLTTDPLADFTVSDLYRFLDAYSLPREIGSVREYSNLGYALLGLALSRATGKEYGDLVQARIASPLGMRRTGTSLTLDMASRRALGHDEELRPVQSQRLDVHVSAGGLYSTANDLLLFLAANLGLTESPFSLVLRDARECRYGVPGAETKFNLAWGECAELQGILLFDHDGGTDGFSSYIAFDPEARRGVVVLSNSHVPVSDIGAHLLQPKHPLVRRTERVPDPSRKVADVDPAHFDRLAGTYEVRPGLRFTITRAGNRLLAQVTGQVALEIFPLSDMRFFYTAVDAEIGFELGPDGRATRLVCYEGRDETRAERVP